MKLKLLLPAVLCVSLSVVNLHAQQRYYDEVFSAADVTDTITYGQNITVLTSPPSLENLKMDVYEPQGDTISERPLIVYVHTGSFLPILFNGTTTGSNEDSAVVQMCTRLAKRGYVVAAMDYRLGWLPLSDSQNVRIGTLLNGVYRALQDAKSCVRYFRKSFANGNPYRIDQTKITLVGQGSGGYVTLAYATINSYADISLVKFYDFVNNRSYVDTSLSGDWNGHGGNGLNVYALNNPGYDESVNMVVNMGGALGDSSWLEAGQVPIVCFHVPYDPYAPSGIDTSCGADCPVIVPTTQEFVVNVCGSIPAERIVNQFHNNDAFALKTFTDAYSIRANATDFGYKGLYLFYTNPPIQAGPWEWWNCDALKVLAPFLGLRTTYVDTVCLISSLTNPDMSKDKATRYIDTVLGFLSPRMAIVLGLTTGIHEVNPYNNMVIVSPNPASDYVEISAVDSKDNIRSVSLYDITGRLVRSVTSLSQKQLQLPRNGLSSGTYLLRVGIGEHEAIKKLMLE